jgi:hypothetical protein
MISRLGNIYKTQDGKRTTVTNDKILSTLRMIFTDVPIMAEVERQDYVTAYDSRHMLYQTRLPSRTSVYKKKATLGIIQTDEHLMPVVEKALIYRNDKMMLTDMFDIKVGDAVMSSLKPKKFDGVPPAMLDMCVYVHKKNEGNIPMYLYDIRKVIFLEADIRQTNVPGMEAILHESGYFVPC